MAYNKNGFLRCWVLTLSLSLAAVSASAQTQVSEDKAVVRADRNTVSTADGQKKDAHQKQEDKKAEQEADAHAKDSKDAADKAYSDALPLVSAIEVQMKQIDLLSERIEVAGAQDREALLYRRDQRTLDLVGQLKQLTPLAVALPKDDPNRVALLERVKKDLAKAGEEVYSRLLKLDQRIDVISASLDGMSGAKWVENDAYLINLEDLRFQFYQSLVDLSKTREQHGLKSLQLLDNLPQQLFQYAETLVGKVEFAGAAINELQKQLKANSKDTELSTAVQELTRERDRYMDNLRISAEMMDDLGLDSTPYRSVLVQQGSEVTIDLIDPAVLGGMIKDNWSKFLNFLAERAPNTIFRVLLFLATLILFYWLSRLFKAGVRAWLDRSRLNMTVLMKELMVSVSAGLVILIGLLIALSQVGISLGPMLAGLGVAGFIMGFALQDTLSNFASGAMILIYRPYDVDDYVEVAGIAGLVKKMTLVSTTIATFDNQILVVPNNKIWGGVIKNVTAQRVRRVDLEFGIGYGDDIEKAEKVLTDLVNEYDKVLRSPEPLVRVHELGDSSVNLIVRPWVRTEDYWEVYWHLTREVKLRFDAEGISIPFPQRDVHIYQPPGAPPLIEEHITITQAGDPDAKVGKESAEAAAADESATTGEAAKPAGSPEPSPKT